MESLQSYELLEMFRRNGLWKIDTFDVFECDFLEYLIGFSHQISDSCFFAVAFDQFLGSVIREDELVL